MTERASATLPVLVRNALLLTLVVTGTACVQPDTVLSVDKAMLEFTLRSRLETHDCTDTSVVPEGTCAEGETEADVWVPGVPSPKTIRLNNSGTERVRISASVSAVVLAEGQDPSTWPNPERAPFQIRVDSEDAGLPDWTTSGFIDIGPRSEVEIQVEYQGSMLTREGLEAAGFSAAAGTVFPNNQRLVLQLVDAEGAPRTDADGALLWEGAPNGIVLRGSVDCQSLGWDKDRDGFCDESSLAAFEPAGDCEDDPGLLGYTSNPDGEEACEDDGAGGIAIDQVDNDCDGFRIRNDSNQSADEDGDGVCDFTKACVPDFDQLTADQVLEWEAELQASCGTALADCNDDPETGAEESPLNPEICEPGDETDQIDTNCNSADDADGLSWFAIDEDGDSFAADPQPQVPHAFPVRYCGPPPDLITSNRNTTLCGGDATNPDCGDPDCDDSRATVFPGAPTICDGQDNDCDGQPDESGDVDLDNDGQAECEGDCDDTNNDVKVGAPEICDGADNNCTGGPDSDEVDDDGDQYFQCEGVPFKVDLQVDLQPADELSVFAAPSLSVAQRQAVVVETVAGSAESITEAGDVVTITFENGVSTTDSLNAMITAAIQGANPPALVGLVTGDGTHIWTTTEEQSVQMDGTLGNDCDDADPLINPGASETNVLGDEFCDGADNNCDGVLHPYESDDDLDGFAECTPTTQAGPAGEELVLTAPASLTTSTPVTVTFVAGASENVSENTSAGTITITFNAGTSSTTALVTLISNAGLSQVTGVSGTGTTPWTPAEAGDVFMGLLAGGDCDDSNDEIALGLPELCDGYDNDCDGLLGDGTNGTVNELDLDGDGWVQCTPNSANLGNTVLGAAGGDDCVDDPIPSATNPMGLSAPFIYPDAPEIADSYYDADPDGNPNTNDATYVLIDNQCPGDTGYDTNGIPGAGEYCEGPNISAGFSCVDSELDLDGDNYSPANGDCDDTNDQMGPQMLEICDGFDNDCDTVIPASEIDTDGDGYIICSPDPSVPLLAGLVGGGDCDETNGNVNPGMPEIADGIDNDCDTSTASPGEVDGDGDGYCPASTCLGTALPDDCDDGNASVNPGVTTELCDGIDDDCDGLVGDGTGGQVDEFDDDGDGWTVCDPSGGSVVLDCLEHSSEILAAFPSYPVDSAGDAVNWVEAASAVFPGNPEVCDGWNNDCLNTAGAPTGIPTATLQEDEFDDDGDGFVDCLDSAAGAVGWTTPAIQAQANLDLDGANDCADVPADTDDPNNANDGPTSGPLTTIFPGATELCDGWDNTCLGAAPPFVGPNSPEWDDDLDQYLDCEEVTITTGAVNTNGDAILGGYDCLDDPSTDSETPSGNWPPSGAALTTAMAASVNPGATEVCDGFNTDCAINSTPTLAVMPTAADVPGEMDNDADQYVECSNFVSTGAAGMDGDDCLDVPLSTNSWSDNVNPGADADTLANVATACDGWDTDCSNQPAFPDNDGQPCGDDGLCPGESGYPGPDAGENALDEFDEDDDGYIQCGFAVGALNNGPTQGDNTNQVIDGGDCLDTASNPRSDDVNPAANTDAVANESTTCDGWDTDCSNQPAYPDNDGEPCGDDGLCPGESGYTAPDAGEDDLGEFDHDNDSWIECNVTATDAAGNGPSVGSQTQVLDGDDCLDVLLSANPYSDNVNPGADADTLANIATACDGWDTDCSNQPGWPENDGEPCGDDGLCPGESGYTSADAGEDDLDEFDADNDGHIQCFNGTSASPTLASGAANNGPSVGSQTQVVAAGDCLDDASNAYSNDVNPAATETCDSWDTDCDSQPAYPANDGLPEAAEEIDDDGDGYIQCDFSAAVDAGGGENNGYGGVIDGSDCLDVLLSVNSYSDDVNPGEAEVCDSYDTDCSSQPAYPNNDAEPDEADEVDDDGDGYVQCDYSTATSNNGATNNGFGGVIDGGDCLDTLLTANPYSEHVNPAATEVCDSWDTDCDSQAAYPNNDGTPEDADELDQDGDGYVQCDYPASVNTNGGENNGFGGAVDGSDCLDVLLTSNSYSDDVNPAETETCDSWDTDCDSQPAYPNNDGEPEDPDEIDDDGDLYVQCDFSGTVLVNGGANNGFGGVLLGSDCLDVALSSNAYSDNVNPGATETCDSWDTDCDSQAAYPNNDGEPEDPDEVDDDGDTYIHCDFSATALAGGAANNGFGSVINGSDCLDELTATNPYADNVNPGATEICDSFDTDCDSQAAYPNNDGEPEDPDELDQDEDGYVQCDFDTLAISGGAVNNGYNWDTTTQTALSGSDCLDVLLSSNAWSDDVNPGETSDVCDGWDTDCDSQPAYPGNDGTPEDSDELDDDSDGYFECTLVTGTSAATTRNSALGDDCLDEAAGLSYNLTVGSDPPLNGTQAAAVNPGVATDVCDGFDTDCSSGNSTFMPDPTQEPNEFDADGDDYMICSPLESYAPTGLGGGDCDNTFSGSGINPGVSPDDASSLLTDNDCDGLYDEDAFVAGDLALTEVMVDPGGGDTQWFEVVNQSTRTLSLEGLVIADQGSESFTLTEPSGDPNTAPLQLTAGTYDIICIVPANYPGGSGDFASDCLNANNTTGFTLENAADEIVLTMASTTVDLMAWSSNASASSDRSTTLDFGATPYQTENDTLDLSNAVDWCQPVNQWTGGGGAYGSPGLQNQPCDADQLDLDGDGLCPAGRDTRGVTGSSPPDGDCDDPGEASNTEFDCFDSSTDTYAASVHTGNSAEGIATPAEVCDGYDTDCTTLGGTIPSDELDTDGDGYIECTNYVVASTAVHAGGNDCLDTSDSYSDQVNPNVAEACDGYDTDCSVYAGGGANTSAPDQADEEDDDLDRYIECDGFVSASTAQNGSGQTLLDGNDCLDDASDAYSDDVNPGETEACDGYDTDCSVYVGGGANTSAPHDTDEVDDDGDRYIVCASFVATTTAVNGASQSLLGGNDCLDTADSYSDDVNPGASEACDGYDTNCSVYVGGGANTSAPDQTDEDDADDDQYIECTGFVAATTAQNGQSEALLGDEDCNDAQDFTYPGAPELCDSIDNDCDTVVDDGLDGDGDGVTTCGPNGINGDSDDDCDDTDNTVFPAATELCDGQLNDCNGTIGAGEVDADGDQHSVCALDAGGWDGSGTVTAGGDCQDSIPTINPSASEICDGYDSDCAGGLGTGTGGEADETDADSDNHYACTFDATAAGNGDTLLNDDDCQDAIPTINTAASEICDGYDSDCAGGLGDGTGGEADETDADGDSNYACTFDATAVSNGDTLLADDDCNDAIPTINENASEICDGYDSDCAGGLGTGTGGEADETDTDGDSHYACTFDATAEGNGDVLLDDGDCLDTGAYGASVNNNQTEACDGYDTDCAGDGANATDETDADNDGYYICTNVAGANIGSSKLGGDDCLDSGTGANGTAANQFYPMAGDAAGGDGEDLDCDGRDCESGDLGVAGADYATGPYYMYCAFGTADDNAAALTACETTLDGHTFRLAEMSDSNDNDDAVTFVATSATAWIGADDSATEGDFLWDVGANNSGADLGDFVGDTTFEAWATGEPSTGASADCAYMDDAGDWFDSACNANLTGYICEAP